MNFTYDGLFFHLPFEDMKDEIGKHKMVDVVLQSKFQYNFIMFMEELSSLVLNTIFLFF